MGADIHCYIEYRRKPCDEEKEPTWQSHGGHINPGRNYILFSLMAGVRNVGNAGKYTLFLPKGLPENLGYRASMDTNPDWHSHSWLTAGELNKILNKYYILEQEQWEESNKNRIKLLEELRNNRTLTDEELSGSWVNKPFLHELAEEYRAILSSMETLEKLGFEARMVFWFDN